MRKWITGLAAVGAILTVGCGPESKVADTPSAEQIKADQEEQKKVEMEERGPQQPKKRK